MLVLLVVVFLLAFWYVVYQRWTRTLRILSYIPGVKPRFIIGNLGAISSTDEVLPALTEIHTRYGPITKYSVFNEVTISIADCRFVEYILNSDILDKSRVYKFARNWVGTGILTAPAQVWRRNRKIITPGFHIKLLEQFVDIFDKQSRVLVNRLAKECGNDGFNFPKYISECTLDIICESAMGISINAQTNNLTEYTKSIHRMCCIFAERTSSLVQSVDFFYYFTKNYGDELRALKVLHEQTNAVIKMKRDQKAKRSNGTKAKEDDVAEEVGAKKRQAFLDILMNITDADGNALLTDRELRQEVDTMLFAGHDTTSTSTSFAMYALSVHQDVQDKIYDEQYEIYGNDKDRPVTFKDLQEMKYLEQVIKEILRLYPPVPFFTRVNDKDRIYDGKPLPKDTVFLINAYVIHRNPEFYQDPEKFDPDRFSSERPIKPYTFLPFSAGPRGCIGQRYAMLELKTLLSVIVRHFRILPTNPPHEMDITYEAILKSKNGIYVRFAARE